MQNKQEKSCCNLKNDIFWIDKTKQGDKIITIEKKLKIIEKNC